MGMLCPECGERSAIVRNITADGEGAVKASDVLAHKLACGHTVGGEKYNEFLDNVKEIDLDAAKEIEQIKRDAQSRKAALWKDMSEVD